MSDALLIDAVRTPIGKHRGGLATVRADDLAAVAVRAIVERNGIDPARVDEVILGCTNQAGEDNRNVARMAALLAGFPNSVPGLTVNRLCGSGLEAVAQAARLVLLGEADLVVAGGVESMTRAPWSMPKSPIAFANGPVTAYDTSLGWRYPNPKMAELFPLEQMGETAENVQRAFGIAREAQDELALRSHQNALAAWEAGRFAAEVVPVLVPQRRGPPSTFTEDESPRRNTSMERLAALRPVFRKDGTVTAGNASPLNDGAAAVLVVSQKAAREFGLEPLGRWISSGTAGVDPRLMGIGPIPASRRALERANRSSEDIALWELNEAFAVQVLACAEQLAVPPDRLNVNGGAIALGHPLGCSGARILTTLLHELRRRGGGLGVATMCIGVGQGIAAVVEV